MSSPKYETLEQLIQGIKTVTEGSQQQRVTFKFNEELYFFYIESHEVEIPGNKSRMSLEKFGDVYKAEALEVLLRTMESNESYLGSI